jgi:flagellum-specific peptidoglycan hydrolase FlgJ
MIKKLVFLLFIATVIGCSSSQPVVRTSKPVYRKPGTSVTKTQRKPTPTRTTPSRTTPTRTTSKPVAGNPKPTSTRTTQQNTELQKIEEKYESAKEENKSDGNATVYSKTEILEATTRVKVTTAMVNDYIATYKETAKNNMTQYGIPASIILGQGILESGAGTGPLSVLANNHFGIKCHKEWTGPSVKYDDDEEQECFRKYDVPGESYKDHSLFLTSRSRYLSLFQLGKDDYKAWAKGLKEAGYATDPKYPDKLIAIIERYQLGQYDAEVLGNPFTPVNNTFTKPSVQSASTDTYEVTQGDTLYSISKRFNITVEDLRRKNDLQDNAISIGQNLIIK